MLPSLNARGTRLFSPDELDALVKTVVEPELGANHTMAVVAATNTRGVEAALLFRKPIAGGEFRCEAAWQHDWGGDSTIGGRVVWAW